MFTDFTRAVTDPKISRGVTRGGRDHTAPVKLALVHLIKSDTSRVFKQLPVSSAETTGLIVALRVRHFQNPPREERHSQSFRESGAQSTDWLLAGARLGGLDTEPALWMLLPKLVPSCRRLMWRITAVALKACCEDRRRV